jgi:sodium-dependent dicarboxylate transporter 2/3/5
MRKQVLLRYCFLVMGPLLFITIAFLAFPWLDSQVRKVLGVTAWILLWWITEAVSIPATALLPLVLFPFLGILDLNATAANYANPTVFLFMAGFVFALAMEKHHLHTRIALYIVRLVGTESDRLVLGFMIATAFVSMWVNNTATTLLMLPIATSVLTLMKEEFVNQGMEGEFRNFAVSILLSLAYCAGIGGIATIIGTPTNAVLIGYLQELYQIDLTFTGWFIVGFPLSVLMLSVAYIVLVKLLFPVKIQTLPGAARMIAGKIAELGPVSFQEYAVGLVFFLTAIGWILRVPLMNWLGLPFLNDTIIGLSGALLLFIIPDADSKNGFLFDWESMKKMSWGILFLIGGGLALAKALENAGVIKMIGVAIASTGTHHYLTLLIIITGICLVLKQFIGNVALATIALPMAFGIADSAGIPPIMLGAPVIFAASFGFMLPMATPPNAIVFTGLVQIKDMLRAGTLLVIAGFLLLLVASFAYQWMI